MGYTHLSIYEGGRIEKLIYYVFSKREIVRKLDRSPSTIGRELKRISNANVYDRKEAQVHYEKHREHSIWGGKCTKEL